ncbi:MAG TPA: DUF1080 domain-containing protein, partial [Lentisphaeria bacterium]|nr:DUF1080 domain-containing protein [Lentisphaeria bacterium]
MADEIKTHPGYPDTPMLPGTPWRVHDGQRPLPPVVTAGRFPTQEQSGLPPSDALVLFDGKNSDEWVGKDGQPHSWKVADGYIESVPKAGNIHTRSEFGDCQVHVEYQLPILAAGQEQTDHGNSGIFMMRLYEIQIIDNWNYPVYADGIPGAVYGQQPPLVNAAPRRGQWSAYDIIWIAPRFAGDKLLAPAYLTLFMDSILLHHMQPMLGPTQFKKLA